MVVASCTQDWFLPKSNKTNAHLNELKVPSFFQVYELEHISAINQSM